MKNKKVRVGLIGIGQQMRHNVLPSLLQIPGISIVAACDLDETRARTACTALEHDVAIYTRADAMIESDGVDAIVMACFPHVHYRSAMHAMALGIDVFVEKPPCQTLTELEHLAGMAGSLKIVTGVGMNFRFAECMQYVRKAILTRKFGEIVHLQIEHFADKPQEPLWGVKSLLRSFLLAQAIHPIDLTTIFGGSIQEIHSRVRKYKNSILAQIEILTETGMTASLVTGTIFPRFDFRIRAITDRADVISMDNLRGITIHRSSSRDTFGAGKHWRASYEAGALSTGYLRTGYRSELEAFFSAVVTRSPFEASFAKLLPAYRAIEAICAAH